MLISCPASEKTYKLANIEELSNILCKKLEVSLGGAKYRTDWKPRPSITINYYCIPTEIPIYFKL